MDQQRQGPVSVQAPARDRSYSVRSEQSENSASKKQTESHLEKERHDSIYKADSKANPNAAMIEAQPGDRNLLERTTIDPLRNYQHKDARGNVITDPDLSNPTRPRMERPLDTIRAFEKAIDSGYKRRTVMRGDSMNDQTNGQFASRRNSYVGGEYAQRSKHYNNANGKNAGHENGRHSQVGGYYNSRQSNYADGPQAPHSQQRSRYGPRSHSDSTAMRGNSGAYPQHAYQQSQDTVMTHGTNGSDSTGPWANSTDPSSENSSIERMNAGVPSAIMEEQQYGSYPQQQSEPQRRPINLSSAEPPAPRNLPQTPRPEPEKRKSWLSRRFSKKG